MRTIAREIVMPVDTQSSVHTQPLITFVDVLLAPRPRKARLTLANNIPIHHIHITSTAIHTGIVVAQGMRGQFDFAMRSRVTGAATALVFASCGRRTLAAVLAQRRLLLARIALVYLAIFARISG